jgi:hypothetical protein
LPTNSIGCWAIAANRLAQDKVLRQALHKEFIETATQCYADALQHEKPDIPASVNLLRFKWRKIECSTSGLTFLISQLLPVTNKYKNEQTNNKQN